MSITDITGVGESTAEELRDRGITSKEQLAEQFEEVEDVITPMYRDTAREELPSVGDSEALDTSDDVLDLLSRIGSDEYTVDGDSDVVALTRDELVIGEPEDVNSQQGSEFERIEIEENSASNDRVSVTPARPDAVDTSKLRYPREWYETAKAVLENYGTVDEYIAGTVYRLLVLEAGDVAISMHEEMDVSSDTDELPGFPDPDSDFGESDPTEVPTVSREKLNEVFEEELNRFEKINDDPVEYASSGSRIRYPYVVDNPSSAQTFFKGRSLDRFTYHDRLWKAVHRFEFNFRYADGENLTHMDGLGQTTANRLHMLGIRTQQQLADALLREEEVYPDDPISDELPGSVDLDELPEPRRSAARVPEDNPFDPSGVDFSVSTDNGESGGSDDGDGDDTEMDVEGITKLSLGEAWDAYRAARNQLKDAEPRDRAEQPTDTKKTPEEARYLCRHYAAVINGIRQSNGQEPIEFDPVEDTDFDGGAITPEDVDMDFEGEVYDDAIDEDDDPVEHWKVSVYDPTEHFRDGSERDEAGESDDNAGDVEMIEVEKPSFARETVELLDGKYVEYDAFDAHINPKAHKLWAAEVSGHDPTSKYTWDMDFLSDVDIGGTKHYDVSSLERGDLLRVKAASHSNDKTKMYQVREKGDGEMTLMSVGHENAIEHL